MDNYTKNLNNNGFTNLIALYCNFGIQIDKNKYINSTSQARILKCFI